MQVHRRPHPDFYSKVIDSDYSESAFFDTRSNFALYLVLLSCARSATRDIDMAVPSVCPSITLRNCVETDKRIVENLSSR